MEFYLRESSVPPETASCLTEAQHSVGLTSGFLTFLSKFFHKKNRPTFLSVLVDDEMKLLLPKEFESHIHFSLISRRS